MICESCGGTLKPGDEFCRSCGAKVEEKKETVETVETVVPAAEDVYTAETSVAENVVAKKEQQVADKPGFAIAGLVLGSVGFIAWIFPLLGYPVTIVGLVMSAKGVKSSMKGMAIAGLVLCIITLCMTLGNSCLGACLSVAGLM